MLVDVKNPWTESPEGTGNTNLQETHPNLHFEFYEQREKQAVLKDDWK